MFVPKRPVDYFPKGRSICPKRVIVGRLCVPKGSLFFPQRAVYLSQKGRHFFPKGPSIFSQKGRLFAPKGPSIFFPKGRSICPKRVVDFFPKRAVYLSQKVVAFEFPKGPSICPKRAVDFYQKGHLFVPKGPSRFSQKGRRFSPKKSCMVVQVRLGATLLEVSAPAADPTCSASCRRSPSAGAKSPPGSQRSLSKGSPGSKKRFERSPEKRASVAARLHTRSDPTCLHSKKNRQKTSPYEFFWGFMVL